MTNKYDELFQAEVSRHFPELLKDFGPDGWKWVKAQCDQESEGNPHAISSCGAQGLMQLMPSLSKDMGIRDPFDPQSNIMGGVIYLAEQYRHFPEIPLPSERLKFSFASYNGGRGYVNKAIQLVRAADADWKTWANVAPSLANKNCTVAGKRPDYRQISGYVSSIIKKRAEL